VFLLLKEESYEFLFLVSYGSSKLYVIERSSRRNPTETLFIFSLVYFLYFLYPNFERPVYLVKLVYGKQSRDDTLKKLALSVSSFETVDVILK